tara:strand:+ start:213 stop:911 length:699 start_codon:yes stop_codon:yes gene_type:complete
MSIFRPTTVSSRTAGVIGPSNVPTCTSSNTTCYSCTNHKDSCAKQAPLGGTATFCGCPCCDCRFCCCCTVVTQVTPSGMYTQIDQNKYRTEGKWGQTSSSSNTSSTFQQVMNNGYADCSNVANVGGRIICKSGSQVLVLANCCDSGPKREYGQRGQSVSSAQSATGKSGFFVPSCSCMKNVFTCMQSYGERPYFTWWSDTSGAAVNMNNNQWRTGIPSHYDFWVRPMRTQSY